MLGVAFAREIRRLEKVFDQFRQRTCQRYVNNSLRYYFRNHLSDISPFTILPNPILYFPEFKKARAELKKRSTDTLRLQKKKARKGQVHLHVQGQSQVHGTCSGDIELNRMLESSAAVVQEKRLSLEETERKAVRAALLEERGRFCLLARFLKPVLVSTSHRYFYKFITKYKR